MALRKTCVAKDRRCQESLNRSDRHMVCRLDRATEQLRLACRLSINPQTQLCPTEEQKGAGDQAGAVPSSWVHMVQPSTGAMTAGAVSALPLPRLSCPAMIKSNWK